MSSTQAKGFHDHYLSPAEAFRNEYYRLHQLSLGEDDDSMLCRPSIDIYTPLIDKEDEDDISDNLSLTDSAHMTLFEPKSPMEPKIVLEDSGKKNDNNTLLSKLSRTTAPMRAKLSTFSKSAPTFDTLLASSSTALTLPLRKPVESDNQSLFGRKKSKKERSHSFSFDKPSSPNLSADQIVTIYPALLSRVADLFKAYIVLRTRVKDSIKYHDVFDGREAVYKLASIIGTNDRNLAVLVGRALDQQKFFHDVNYEHRLRDSVHELYQFRQNIITKRTVESVENEEELPNGVFTLLTNCYSPTCTEKMNCYSPLCPRRSTKEIIADKKKLQRTSSQNSLLNTEDRLWINTVPKSVLASLSNQEKRRQENIFELIYTESDFVNDLTYVEQYWITRLRSDDCIPSERREKFISDLFWNLPDVRKANSQLIKQLLHRQSLHSVVDEIGDIFLKHVKLLDPFVEYGAHQFISKYVFETEKSTNPAFAKFVESIERLPESRKLELNGYLTKPTTRLGRYNLLLREIMKHTPDDHSDKESLPKVMAVIGQYLSRVNEESGKTENRFSLEILQQKLTYRKADPDVDALDLLADERRIILKGPLKRKGAASESTSELQVYVLDHCLLIIKSKYFDNIEKFKLYKKPIPLALLAISLPDRAKRSSSIIPYNRASIGSFHSTGNTISIPAATSTSNKNGYPISFIHLGRNGSGILTLYASTFASRRKWVDTIERYRHSVMEKTKVFSMNTVSDQFFNSFNKVNCAAEYKSNMIIGSDNGVFIKKAHHESDDEMVRILAADKVSQIDILPGPKLILILADKILYAHPIDSFMDKLDDVPTVRQMRKINSSVSFFKVGNVFDKTIPDKPIERTLVCFVKYNSMTSIIRALEPYDDGADVRKKRKKNNKPQMSLFMRNQSGALRGFKDLYIPGEATSLQYFKNVICVGSAKGFQMVDVGTTNVQSVLDPNDECHNFIAQRETLKPISMFRHPEGDILLCYNEIAFYIDKKGRRVQKDWIIEWEGHPSSFAFFYPYVLAFDSSFIEIRHMNS
ncbi:hypothetical protein K501DRAFT_208418, partial [Backusella circina FSU 941]